MAKEARTSLFFLLTLFSLPAFIAACFPSPATPTPSPPEADPTISSDSLVIYDSSEYGFAFSLPRDWANYSIRVDEWQGLALDSVQGDVVVEEGPVIAIVHPNSTSEKQRQDIPIMVFTIQQWDALQRGEWHIGAAPIGPAELARNRSYVFALPARYNYAFLEGWEEVEQILHADPIRAFEPSTP